MDYQGDQPQPDGSLRLRIPDGSYIRVVFGEQKGAPQARRCQRKALASEDMTVMDCLRIAWRSRSVCELRESEWTPELLAEREFHASRGERLWAYMSRKGNLITVPRPEPDDPYPVIEAMFAKQEALGLYREAFSPTMARLYGCEVAQAGQRLTRWGVRKSAADFREAPR